MIFRVCLKEWLRNWKEITWGEWVAGSWVLKMGFVTAVTESGGGIAVNKRVCWRRRDLRVDRFLLVVLGLWFRWCLGGVSVCSGWESCRKDFSGFVSVRLLAVERDVGEWNMSGERRQGICKDRVWNLNFCFLADWDPM